MVPASTLAALPLARPGLALPRPRGPVSALLLEALTAPVHELPALDVPAPDDPLAYDDLQLALYLCYELHYLGLPGVEAAWEWEPSLLALRRRLERHFEAGLHAALRDWTAPAFTPETMDVALREVIDADDGPSVSLYLQREGTAAQYRECLAHRSAYQLKEADPHSWALPRLTGRAKAALVEIQADEYGGGRAERIHATLFARTLELAGLDPRYGAYVDRLPGVTLATVNLMSLFGLHRRWRGAIVGHLALFEMTSAVGARRYADGLRRLGFPEQAVDFFDEHVEADAIHESVAAVDLAGGLAASDPEVGGDILWGARALTVLDARWAQHVLGAFAAGHCSLRAPLEVPVA